MYINFDKKYFKRTFVQTNFKKLAKLRFHIFLKKILLEILMKNFCVKNCWKLYKFRFQYFCLKQIQNIDFRIKLLEARCVLKIFVFNYENVIFLKFN